MFDDTLTVTLFPEDCERLRTINSDNDWLFKTLRLSFWKAASRFINSVNSLLNNFFMGYELIGAWRLWVNRRNEIYSRSYFVNSRLFMIYNRFWQFGFNLFSRQNNFDFYFWDRVYNFILTLKRFLIKF